MVAVVAVCRNALVGTGWSNYCLVCTNRLRKHCSHLVESSFLAVKGFSSLNGVCWPRMLIKQSSLMSRRGLGHESAYHGVRWYAIIGMAPKKNSGHIKSAQMTRLKCLRYIIQRRP